MRYILALLTFISSTCFSSQGFHTLDVQAPSFVRNAAEGVYFLKLDEAKSADFATAVLVKASYGPAVSELYFLTNAHVFEEQCHQLGRCKNLKLYQNIELIFDFETKKIKGQGENEIDHVEIVRLSQNPDLALLRATVLTRPSQNFHILQLATNCSLASGEQLFTIGFPGVNYRYNFASQSLPGSDTIVKRWSQGIYETTNNMAIDKISGPHEFLFTSVDTLPGNSGGPLLNSRGEIVGISQASSAIPENGYRYTGNEELGKTDWSSVAVPCHYLRPFIFNQSL